MEKKERVAVRVPFRHYISNNNNRIHTDGDNLMSTVYIQMVTKLLHIAYFYPGQTYIKIKLQKEINVCSTLILTYIHIECTWTSSIPELFNWADSFLESQMPWRGLTGLALHWEPTIKTLSGWEWSQNVQLQKKDQVWWHKLENEFPNVWYKENS